LFCGCLLFACSKRDDLGRKIGCTRNNKTKKRRKQKLVFCKERWKT